MNGFSPHRLPPGLHRYVAPALRYNALWRVLVGLGICLAVYLVWILLVVTAIKWTLGARTLADAMALLGRTDAPGGLLLVLSTFFGMALGPMVAARLLHGRGAATLFGPRATVLRDFVLCAGLTGVAYALALLPWVLWFDAVPNLDPGTWLRLLPITLIALLVQTVAEELVFRGYLQQQLAARFRTPLVWMILPSLLFGAVHYDPATAGDNVGLLMLTAAVFGLAAANLTAVTGSLGAAWGLHFTNNLVALALLSTEGSLTGLSLFKTPYGIDTPVLPWLVLVDLMTLGVAWGLCRAALRP